MKLCPTCAYLEFHGLRGSPQWLFHKLAGCSVVRPLILKVKEPKPE